MACWPSLYMVLKFACTRCQNRVAGVGSTKRLALEPVVGLEGRRGGAPEAVVVGLHVRVVAGDPDFAAGEVQLTAHHVRLPVDDVEVAVRVVGHDAVVDVGREVGFLLAVPAAGGTVFGAVPTVVGAARAGNVVPPEKPVYMSAKPGPSGKLAVDEGERHAVAVLLGGDDGDERVRPRWRPWSCRW